MIFAYKIGIMGAIENSTAFIIPWTVVEIYGTPLKQMPKYSHKQPSPIKQAIEKNSFFTRCESVSLSNKWATIAIKIDIVINTIAE